MKTRGRPWCAWAFLSVAITGLGAQPAAAGSSLIPATTTSTQDSGLPVACHVITDLRFFPQMPEIAKNDLGPRHRR